MSQLATLLPQVAPQVFVDTSNEHADILVQLNQFHLVGDLPLLPLPEGIHFIFARDLYQNQLVICHDYILTTNGKRVLSRYRQLRGGPIGMCLSRPGGTPRVVVHWDVPQFGTEPLINYARSISLAQLVLRGTQHNPDWSHFTDALHIDRNNQNNHKDNLQYSVRIGRRGHGKKVPQVSAIIGS